MGCAATRDEGGPQEVGEYVVAEVIGREYQPTGEPVAVDTRPSRNGHKGLARPPSHVWAATF